MKALATVAALAATAVLCITSVFAQAQKQAQKMDSADVSAMKKLAESQMKEIDMGKAATSKAESQDVKRFGQKMVDDHSKILADLQKLAKAKDISLPDSASLKDRALLKKMELSSGAKFDEEYMDEMVRDHENDVKETDEIASKAKDAQFKAAVKQANTKVKEHLQLARQIAGAAAGGTSGRSSSK